MKKRLLSLTLTLCLIVCLVSGLAVSVSAGESLTVGQSFYRTMVGYDECMLTIEGENGSLPSGMYCSVVGDGRTIAVSGTPTQTGTFSYTAYYTAENVFTGVVSESSVSIAITVSEAATPEPPPSEAPKTEAPADAPKTEAPANAAPATAAPGAPVITKNPTNETVEVGGSCEFTANATGAAWWAWRFIKGNETVIFDVVGDRFPGMKIEGGNDLTFRLSNIPKELDGWDVACIFGNAGGQMTLSGLARVTVTEKGTPEPSATPEATATPEPTATPAPTEAPTPEPTATPAPTEAPTPEPTATPEPEKSFLGGNAILYVLLAAVVVLIALVVILLTKMKKKDEYAEDREYDRYDRRR